MLVKQVTATVTAYVSYATFEEPKQGPYVETYVSIIGASLHLLKNTNGTYQGAVEVAIKFLQNDEIKSARKYGLTGPPASDTNRVANFIDQQRFPLANGDYIMEITISDKNKPSEPFSEKIPIQIQFNRSNINISDIQLLETFNKSVSQGPLAKSGYDLVPYISSFYPENLNVLKFYAEVYHSNLFVKANDRIVICQQKK